MRSARALLVVASLLLTAIAVAPAASAHMVCGQGMCCGFDGDPDPGSPDALADEASHSLCWAVYTLVPIAEKAVHTVECLLDRSC